MHSPKGSCDDSRASIETGALLIAALLMAGGACGQSIPSQVSGQDGRAASSDGGGRWDGSELGGEGLVPVVDQSSPVGDGSAREDGGPRLDAWGGGSIYYIAPPPKGSDSHNGSVDSPWSTIGFAKSKLKPGDLLYVRGGTYVDNQGMYYTSRWAAPSGTAGKPITIRAYPGETPVFDGKDKSLETCVQLVGADWIIIDGLTFQNFRSWAIWMGNDLADDPSEHNTITNCTFRDIGSHPTQHHAIYLAQRVRDVTITRNLIVHASCGGIHGWHEPGVQGALIANNVIMGCGAGLLFADGADGLEVHNNVLYRNNVGINFWNQGEKDRGGKQIGVLRVMLRNNIIVSDPSKDQDGLKIGYGTITADYNLYYPGQHSSSVASNEFTDPGTHSITQKDPLFADPGHEDFHLKSKGGRWTTAGWVTDTVSSPAIDAGDPSLPYGNEPSPNGKRINLGAYGNTSQASKSP